MTLPELGVKFVAADLQSYLNDLAKAIRSTETARQQIGRTIQVKFLVDTKGLKDQLNKTIKDAGGVTGAATTGGSQRKTLTDEEKKAADEAAKIRRDTRAQEDFDRWTKYQKQKQAYNDDVRAHKAAEEEKRRAEKRAQSSADQDRRRAETQRKAAQKQATADLDRWEKSLQRSDARFSYANQREYIETRYSNQRMKISSQLGAMTPEQKELADTLTKSSVDAQKRELAKLRGEEIGRVMRESFENSFLGQLARQESRTYGARIMASEMQRLGFSMFGAGVGGLYAGQRLTDRYMTEFRQPVGRVQRALGLTPQLENQLDAMLLQRAGRESFQTAPAQAESLRAWAEAINISVKSTSDLQGLVEMSDMISNVVKLNEGTASLEQTTKDAASIMTQFGLATGDADTKVANLEQIVSLLDTAASTGLAEINDIGMAMNYWAGSAHNLGISVTEATAAVEMLAAAGQKGSKAGRGLDQVLKGITAPTPKAVAQYEKMFGQDWQKLFFEDTPKQEFKGLANYLQLMSQATMKMGEAERASTLAALGDANARRMLTYLLDKTNAARAKGIEMIGREVDYMKTLTHLRNYGSKGIEDDVKVLEAVSGAELGSLSAIDRSRLRVKELREEIATEYTNALARLDAAFLEMGKGLSRSIVPALKLVAGLLETIANIANVPLLGGAFTTGAVGLAGTGATLMAASGVIRGAVNAYTVAEAMIGAGGNAVRKELGWKQWLIGMPERQARILVDASAQEASIGVTALGNASKVSAASMLKGAGAIAVFAAAIYGIGKGLDALAKKQFQGSDFWSKFAPGVGAKGSVYLGETLGPFAPETAKQFQMYREGRDTLEDYARQLGIDVQQTLGGELIFNNITEAQKQALVKAMDDLAKQRQSSPSKFADWLFKVMYGVTEQQATQEWSNATRRLFGMDQVDYSAKDRAASLPKTVEMVQSGITDALLEPSMSAQTYFGMNPDQIGKMGQDISKVALDLVAKIGQAGGSSEQIGNYLDSADQAINDLVEMTKDGSISMGQFAVQASLVEENIRKAAEEAIAFSSIQTGYGIDTAWQGGWRNLSQTDIQGMRDDRIKALADARKTLEDSGKWTKEDIDLWIQNAYDLINQTSQGLSSAIASGLTVSASSAEKAFQDQVGWLDRIVATGERFKNLQESFSIGTFDATLENAAGMADKLKEALIEAGVEQNIASGYAGRWEEYLGFVNERAGTTPEELAKSTVALQATVGQMAIFLAMLGAAGGKAESVAQVLALFPSLLAGANLTPEAKKQQVGGIIETARKSSLTPAEAALEEQQDTLAQMKELGASAEEQAQYLGFSNKRIAELGKSADGASKSLKKLATEDIASSLRDAIGSALSPGSGTAVTSTQWYQTLAMRGQRPEEEQDSNKQAAWGALSAAIGAYENTAWEPLRRLASAANDPRTEWAGMLPGGISPGTPQAQMYYEYVQGRVEQFDPAYSQYFPDRRKLMEGVIGDLEGKKRREEFITSVVNEGVAMGYDEETLRKYFESPQEELKKSMDLLHTGVYDQTLAQQYNTDAVNLLTPAVDNLRLSNDALIAAIYALPTGGKQPDGSTSPDGSTPPDDKTKPGGQQEAAFARGGYVQGAGRAIVGEVPEIILPLSQAGRFLREALQGQPIMPSAATVIVRQGPQIGNINLNTSVTSPAMSHIATQVVRAQRTMAGGLGAQILRAAAREGS